MVSQELNKKLLLLFQKQQLISSIQQDPSILQLSPNNMEHNCNSKHIVQGSIVSQK
jgi:hypothetical protein